MNARMIGLFSGFPDRRFPDEIAARLKAEIAPETRRSRLTEASFLTRALPAIVAAPGTSSPLAERRPATAKSPEALAASPAKVA